MTPMFWNDDDAAQSRSRIDTIREGIATVDRATWRHVAECRIANLEVEEAMFGLEDFEETELAELRAMLEDNHA